MAAKAFIICATPRSGSTLLCRMLAATGVAGRPDSFYREASLAEWCGEWGLAHADAAPDVFETRYLAAARAEGTSANGVFSMRLMQENLDDLNRRLGKVFPKTRPGPPRIDAAFGPTRYLHLYREDKIAQAVSLVRAQQTGLWHRAADGSELERLAPPAPPYYDRRAIERAVADYERYEQGWQRWFDEHDLCVFRVGYEDMARAPRQALTQILGWLGLDPALAMAVTPDVARLSDAVNDGWIERFRAEHHG